MVQEAIFGKEIPACEGTYSQAIRLGDFIFISAQLPIDPESGEIVSEHIAEQTEQCLKNIESIMKECGLLMRHVLQMRVAVTDVSLVKEAEPIFERYLRKPYPARTVTGVKELFGKAKIQIEAVAIDTRALEILYAGSNEDDCGCEGCGE